MVPAPDVPLDPEAFDRWARDQVERWRHEDLAAVARPIWADPGQAAARRAVAALALRDEVATDDLRDLIGEARLPAEVEARVRVRVAALASAHERERAREEVATACVLADGVVGVPERLSLWSSAGTLLVGWGDLDGAGRLLDRSVALLREPASSDLPASTHAEVEALALEVALGRHRVAPEEGRIDALTGTARALIDRSRSVAPGHTPAVLGLRAGSALLEVGEPQEAAAVLASVADATDAEAGLSAEALSVHFEALLALADARGATDGMEAAIEVQRQAIEAVRSLGPTPMLGWARRGLGHQLRAAGQTEEAVAELGRAVEVMGDVGQGLDAAVLRLDRGRTLLELGLASDALDEAEAVQEGLDQLPAEARSAVEVGAEELAADAVAALGRPEAAVARWLGVADLVESRGGCPAKAQAAAARLMAGAGDPTGALRLLDRAEETALRLGTGSDRATVLARRAEVLWEGGLLDEAEDRARAASDLARQAGEESLAVGLTVLRAEIVLAGGEPDRAEVVLTAALDEADRARIPEGLVRTLEGRLAEVRRELGRPDPPPP